MAQIGIYDSGLLQAINRKVERWSRYFRVFQVKYGRLCRNGIIALWRLFPYIYIQPAQSPFIAALYGLISDMFSEDGKGWRRRFLDP